MIDWTQVPDGYNWVTMDEDGEWWCWRGSPPDLIATNGTWAYDTVAPVGATGELIDGVEWYCDDWTKSLTRRPNNQVGQTEVITFNRGDVLDEDSTPPYYNHVYKGIKLDPYRIAEVYCITDNRQFHIFKKTLRMHLENHKSLEENLDDIIKTAQRWKEMIKEDNNG